MFSHTQLFQKAKYHPRPTIQPHSLSSSPSHFSNNQTIHQAIQPQQQLPFQKQPQTSQQYHHLNGLPKINFQLNLPQRTPLHTTKEKGADTLFTNEQFYSHIHPHLCLQTSQEHATHYNHIDNAALIRDYSSQTDANSNDANRLYLTPAVINPQQEYQQQSMNESFMVSCNKCEKTPSNYIEFNCSHSFCLDCMAFYFFNTDFLPLASIFESPLLSISSSSSSHHHTEQQQRQGANVACMICTQLTFLDYDSIAAVKKIISQTQINFAQHNDIQNNHTDYCSSQQTHQPNQHNPSIYNDSPHQQQPLQPNHQDIIYEESGETLQTEETSRNQAKPNAIAPTNNSQCSDQHNQKDQQPLQSNSLNKVHRHDINRINIFDQNYHRVNSQESHSNNDSQENILNRSFSSSSLPLETNLMNTFQKKTQNLSSFAISQQNISITPPSSSDNNLSFSEKIYTTCPFREAPTITSEKQQERYSQCIEPASTNQSQSKLHEETQSFAENKRKAKRPTQVNQSAEKNLNGQLENVTEHLKEQSDQEEEETQQNKPNSNKQQQQPSYYTANQTKVILNKTYNNTLSVYQKRQEDTCLSNQKRMTVTQTPQQSSYKQPASTKRTTMLKPSTAFEHTEQQDFNKTNQCNQHPHEELRFYSFSQNKCICLQCLSNGAFKKEDVKSFKKGEPILLEKVDDCALQINVTIQLLKLAQKRLEHTYKKQIHSASQAKDYITQQILTIISCFEDKLRHLLNQAEETILQTTNSFSSSTNAFKESLNTLTILQNNFTSIHSSSSSSSSPCQQQPSVEFYKKFQDCKQKLDQFLSNNETVTHFTNTDIHSSPYSSSSMSNHCLSPLQNNLHIVNNFNLTDVIFSVNQIDLLKHTISHLRGIHISPCHQSSDTIDSSNANNNSHLLSSSQPQQTPCKSIHKNIDAVTTNKINLQQLLQQQGLLHLNHPSDKTKLNPSPSKTQLTLPNLLANDISQQPLNNIDTQVDKEDQQLEMTDQSMRHPLTNKGIEENKDDQLTQMQDAKTNLINKMKSSLQNFKVDKIAERLSSWTVGVDQLRHSISVSKSLSNSHSSSAQSTQNKFNFLQKNNTTHLHPTKHTFLDNFSNDQIKLLPFHQTPSQTRNSNERLTNSQNHRIRQTKDLNKDCTFVSASTLTPHPVSLLTNKRHSLIAHSQFHNNSNSLINFNNFSYELKNSLSENNSIHHSSSRCNVKKDKNIQEKRLKTIPFPLTNLTSIINNSSSHTINEISDIQQRLKQNGYQNVRTVFKKTRQNEQISIKSVNNNNNSLGRETSLNTSSCNSTQNQTNPLTKTVSEQNNFVYKSLKKYQDLFTRQRNMNSFQ